MVEIVVEDGDGNKNIISVSNSLLDNREKSLSTLSYFNHLHFFIKIKYRPTVSSQCFKLSQIKNLLEYYSPIIEQGSKGEGSNLRP